MDKNIENALIDGLRKVHEERQKAPNQYVVAYKRKSNDEVIGYHLSTFCQTTPDILRAKRYSGEQPDSQLAIIWKNLCSTLDKTEQDTGFAAISYKVKEEYFPNLTKEDIYIDAVYLSDGMPEQPFTAVIINPNDNNGTGTQDN